MTDRGQYVNPPQKKHLVLAVTAMHGEENLDELRYYTDKLVSQMAQIGFADIAFTVQADQPPVKVEAAKPKPDPELKVLRKALRKADRDLAEANDTIVLAGDTCEQLTASLEDRRAENAKYLGTIDELKAELKKTKTALTKAQNAAKKAPPKKRAKK